MVQGGHQQISIRRQCELVGLNRASYYYQPAGESALNLELMEKIDEQYTQTPFYGYRRITAQLQREAYQINHKRVQRLMNNMGLQAIYPKPKTKKSVEPIRKEIRGIIFFLIAIILGVALFSYHPGDPVFWELKGSISKAQNLFGTVGAHLSGVIFRTVGFSSFWLVLLFLALAVLSFGEHAL